MAAGKWKLYDTAKLKIAQGIIDLDGHTFKMALFQSSSNCNTLTHDELADLTNQVANGNGYTTGGVTITGNTLTNTSGTIKFDIDDTSWISSGAGFSCKFAVIYDGTVSGDPLLCVMIIDTSGLTVTPPESLSIIINASGVFTLSGATTD